MGAPFGATGSAGFGAAGGVGEGAAAAVVEAVEADGESCLVTRGARSRRPATPAAVEVALGSEAGVIVAVVLAGIGGALVGAGSTATVGGGAAVEVVAAGCDASDAFVAGVFDARINTTAATATAAIDTTTPAARPFAKERGRSTVGPRSEL
jgi:hypothetical protein